MKEAESCSGFCSRRLAFGEIFGVRDGGAEMRGIQCWVLTGLSAVGLQGLSVVLGSTKSESEGRRRENGGWVGV